MYTSNHSGADLNIEGVIFHLTKGHPTPVEVTYNSVVIPGKASFVNYAVNSHVCSSFHETMLVLKNLGYQPKLIDGTRIYVNDLVGEEHLFILGNYYELEAGVSNSVRYVTLHVEPDNDGVKFTTSLTYLDGRVTEPMTGGLMHHLLKGEGFILKGAQRRGSLLKSVLGKRDLTDDKSIRTTRLTYRGLLADSNPFNIDIESINTLSKGLGPIRDILVRSRNDDVLSINIRFKK